MSTATTQPEPLRLAQLLESFQEAAASAEQRAAAALRRLHAENLQLRADLEAVGAGGIGPLISTTVQHQIKLSRNNDLQRESGHLSTSSSTAPQPLTDEQIVSMANPTQYLPEAPEGWVRFGFSRKHLVGFARAVLDAAQQPPVVEQPQIDWHDMHLKERRRAEMWIAKYEQDIGKLEVAVPVAAQPQVEQEPVAATLAFYEGEREPRLLSWNRLPNGEHRLYTHPQNLRCKSNQKRLATLWGYVKAEPLTVEQIDGIIRDLDPSWLDTPTGFEEEFCRAIERAHGIGGEA